MDVGDAFLLEYDNGSGGWQQAKRWIVGTDFNDRVWNDDVVVAIDGTGISSIKLQFRCDANARNDKVFIDRVAFKGK